jgi:hypothetical protein
MRSDPLSPLDVLRALELFGPQARPYNFDDCFDCWGLVRRIFDHLDDGDEVDDELGPPGDPREAGWVAFAGPEELVPGDLLTTHPHAGEGFHTVFYCGRVDGLDLVYDASPRALVPLFEQRGGRWRHAGDRAIHTRYARATETTERLRNDGGAYLRLWDDRERFFSRALRARLVAGDTGAGEARAAGRDLVALRRAAGLSELPFYCRRRLPLDAAGREVYDNLLTRHLDYYVPDGAPVLDDDHEAVPEGGGTAGAAARPEAPPGAPRPPAPRLTAAPLWIVRDGPVSVEWEYAGGPSAAPGVTGCRVELWEETWDCWKHRLLRLDLDEPATRFTVPGELLHDDSRFAVVVWARGPGGFSGTALAPFLYRPAPGNPLLEYDPVRPEGLRPDGGAVVRAGEPAELAWRIREPARSQVRATITVLEDACLVDDAEPVFVAELSGPQAAACRAVVPGGTLRDGHTYSWYVSAHASDGRTAYAPAEGVFVVSGEG